MRTTTVTAERTFAAMGTDVHVLVHGPDAEALAERARARIDELEDRWSRFRPDSEVSALNRAGGAPCVVSPDTCLLVELACEAWRATEGRFDPTQLEPLRRLGYERSWPDATAVDRLPAASPAAGCDGIVVDRGLSLVWLQGVSGFDPGGIGKGLAADLVAGELHAAGADGALVNIGGDLRVVGAAPDGGPWRIDVDPPVPWADGERLVVELAEGAIATSSTLRRRWAAADGTDVHHLLDPRTGLPAEPSWPTVTVVAGTGWFAEALTKSVLLGGPLDDEGCAAAAIGADGTVTLLGDRPDLWFVDVPGART